MSDDTRRGVETTRPEKAGTYLAAAPG